MPGKRTTLHNQKGRARKGFDVRHNDRTNTTKAEHIDVKKSKDNMYWTWNGKESFVEAEMDFYNANFRDYVEEKNARYLKNRHFERCQTMKDYYRNKRSCPDESLLYVGKVGDTIEPEKLWKLVEEYRKWVEETYPQYKPLSIALHADETGAPHVHLRGVFVANDKTVNMKKALEEMGIERPDLKKPEGRFNNRKMTFTAACREKFQDLCREAGIEIESTPQERSKTGLSQEEYKARQEEEKARFAVEQREAEEKRLLEIEKRIETALSTQTKIDDQEAKLHGVDTRAKKEKEGFFGQGDDVVKLGINDYKMIMQIAKSSVAAAITAAEEKTARLDADARAKQIEKDANRKIRQARKEVQDAQEIAQEKDKEWFDYQQSMQVYEFAPSDVKSYIENERLFRVEVGHEINRIAARVAQLFPGSEERENVMGLALDYLGVPQAEQADYIEGCFNARQRKGKPREGLSVGGWHPDPVQTDYSVPPTQLPQAVVDEVAPLINPPANDDKSLSGTPWEWLSEMEKFYLQHKNDFVDDY